jgi:hypothetical protein
MSELRTGSCHCGAIVFEVRLSGGLGKLRRCNCSLCRRKGAVMAGVPLDDLRVIRGADKLSLYQWNTMAAKHYFCSVCGIYTHHQRRSNPNEYGFNVACIADLDPSDLDDVPVSDGAALSLIAETPR